MHGHPHAAAFLELMARTQKAYAARDLEGYLGAFAADYSSVRLGTDWSEDRDELRAKIADDFRRFDVLSMGFEVHRAWYAGEIGFAHLGYRTRLRFREGGAVLLDERENLVVGRHLGDGRWELIGKIVLRVQAGFEAGEGPDV